MNSASQKRKIFLNIHFISLNPCWKRLKNILRNDMYDKVVMNQNIPPEFKSMIRKNTNDLIEYLEKYLSSD